MVSPSIERQVAPHPPPYDTIVFDCDSTLSTIEGIEELAGEMRDAVRRTTDDAMEGRATVEAVYGARLELVRPDARRLAALGRRYVESLVPGALELVRGLRSLDKRVCLVSGGLADPVRDLARALGLGREDVFAVEVRLDPAGAYAGFDQDSPMTRSGGKLEVVRRLADEAGPRGVAMVGDGITDLEARPACARFVAYAGVVLREPVLAGADAVCHDLDHAGLVPFLLAPDEIEHLGAQPTFADLIARASATRP
jgi:phosphoserine phosphatase